MPHLIPIRAAKFIGREQELAALQAQLQVAFAGSGSVVTLAGEPGIGKTRTSQEFAELCLKAGAVVLQGRCFEGDWQPPFAPWVEALTAFVRSTPAEILDADLGEFAATLARLLPTVKSRLGNIAETRPLGAEEERYRLHDAVCQWLLAASQRQPLVIILDDLQWADRDSLAMLEYIGHFCSQTCLLILGIHREPDASIRQNGSNGLAGLLGALQREAGFERLRLRGLEPEETGELLQTVGDPALPQPVALAIHRETSGNPFYTWEVFRHLVEEGKLVNRGDRWSTDFSLRELSIPETLRQVVGRRAGHLSSGAQRMLHIAAALASEFDLATLKALTDMSEDALLDAVDEALDAGFLTVVAAPAGGVYDFAHAVVRHALYDSLNPDRKIRLHQQIAETLEALYAGREGEHATELAAQYAAAGGLADARKGVQHALRAAALARRTFARDRVVSFLLIARDLCSAQDDELTEILPALALAQAEALLLEDARASVDDALAVLEHAGAGSASRAAFLAEVARSLKDGGSPPSVWEPLVKRGLSLLSADAQNKGDLLWAQLTLLLDRVEPVASGTIVVGRWVRADPEAVRIVREHGSVEDYARSLEPLEWRDKEETEAIWQQVQHWPADAYPAAVIRGLDVVARDLIYRHSEIATAAERLEEMTRLSRKAGSVPGQAESLTQLALCQVILGRMSQAQQSAASARSLVARLGTEHRLRVAVEIAVGSILAYYLEGDWPLLARRAAQAASGPQPTRSVFGLTAASFAAYNYVRAGEPEEAWRFLLALTPVLQSMDPRLYIYGGSVDRGAAAVWELGAIEFAANYRDLALNLLERKLGGGPMSSMELSAARMSALLGDFDLAVGYFERARRVLEEKHLLPYRAIADHDEAWMWIRASSGDRSHIERLLDSAKSAFAALGMSGWEARSRALLQQLQNPPTATAASHGLTAREIEVLRCVVRGCTNREIAAELVVSTPTVERHLANIYRKIGSRNRASATAFAIEHVLAAAESP